MKLKYMIVAENSFQDLQEEVKQKISEGWLPQGGLSVANSSSMIYAQAMTKKQG